MIITQVEELKNLVNEFSNFARLPATNPAACNLNELINETLVLYRQGHKAIIFNFTQDDSLPQVNLDREQIKRVMINLLENALAASQNKGVIEIETLYNQELQIITLSVADQGTGISAADKERLFEPYFSTKKSGTGLGLTIVSTIISDHNGYIRVRDNQPHGAKFIIELPLNRTINS